MRRRKFITLLGGAAAWPFAAMAQEPGRTYRLGCWLPRARDAPVNVAFFNELRRRGFIEGQNLAVEWRTYGEHIDLIPQYAAELVKARVDVIVIAAGDKAVRALQQATNTIPIVAMGGDLLGSGFVNSLARPDGNTTGVSILAGEADGKRQDILIEAVPGLRLMAVLADVNYANAAKLDALQEAARTHGIEFSIHRVARGEEIAAAIDMAQRIVNIRFADLSVASQVLEDLLKFIAELGKHISIKPSAFVGRLCQTPGVSQKRPTISSSVWATSMLPQVRFLQSQMSSAPRLSCLRISR